MLNGFDDDNMLMLEYYGDIPKEIKFIQKEEQKNKYYYEDVEYSFDNYECISAEIL